MLTLGCAVVAAALPVIAFHEVVFGSKTLQTSTLAGLTSVNGFDDVEPGPPRSPLALLPDAGASAWQTEPWSLTVSRAYHDGEWPFWNPYQGSGKPLAANTISAAFDPLFVGLILHSTPRVSDLSIVGAYSIGSVAMLLFLLSLRARRVAALAGAAIFAFGGYWFFNANNPFSRSYIYIPLLLYLVNRAVARGLGLWTFATALALAGSVLVGMPESTFLVLLVIAVYSVYRLSSVGRDRWRAATVNLGVAAALGIAIAAPLLVLFAEYEPLSFNTHKAGSANGKLVDPAQYLAAWIVPFVNGTITRAWVGGTALALAFLCAAASTRFLRARQVLPFAVLAGIFTWKIYGFPGAVAAGTLPVMDQVKWVTFGVPVLQVLVAILAGIGVDAVLRRQIVVRRLAYVAVGLTLLIAVLFLTNDDVRHSLTITPGLRAFLLAVMGVAVVLIAAWLAVARRLRYAALAAVVMLGVELIILLPPAVYATRVDPFIEQSWFQHIEPARASTPPAEDPARVFGLDGKLFPDTASAVQIYDVRTLDALYVKRYFDLVRTFVDGGIQDRFVGINNSSTETGAQYVNNPIFNLLGVRYLLSGWSDPGSIVDDIAHRAQGSGVDIGTMAVDGADRTALLTGNGATAWVPVPPVGTVTVTGAVSAPDTSAPVNIQVVGERADGSEALLTRVTASPTPAGQAPQWTPFSGDVPDTAYTRVGFRSSSADPNAHAAWLDLKFVDASGAPLSSQYRFVGRDNLTSVYENLAAAPRAFVVHDLERVKNEREALQRMKRGSTKLEGGAHLVDESDFDPFTTAVVEGDAKVAIGDADCAAATVEFVKYTAGKVELQVDSPCPGLLVLTDTYYPGWTATVNGESANILPTDVAFRGVAVPQGTSTVVMRYQPPRFKFALALSALAILAGIGLSVWGVVQGRRRRTGAAVPHAPSAAG